MSIRYAHLYAEAYIDQTKRRQNDIVEHTNDDWQNPVCVTFDSQSYNMAKVDLVGHQTTTNLPSSEMTFQPKNDKLTKLSTVPREQNQSSKSSSSSFSSNATSSSSSSSSSSDAISSSGINWVQCTACKEWRIYTRSILEENLQNPWTCNMNTWDLEYNDCGIEQEKIIADPKYHHPFLGGYHANENSLPDRRVTMLWEAASSYSIISNFQADDSILATVKIRNGLSGRYQSYNVAELSVNINETIEMVRRNIEIDGKKFHVVQREMRKDGNETIDDQKEEEEIAEGSVGSKRKRKPTQKFGAVPAPDDVVVTRDVHAFGSSWYRGLVPVEHIGEIPSPLSFVFEVDEFQGERKDFDLKIVNDHISSNQYCTAEITGDRLVIRDRKVPVSFTGIRYVEETKGWVATFPLFPRQDQDLYKNELFSNNDLYGKEDGIERKSMNEAAKDYDVGMREHPAYQVGNEGGVEVASHHRRMMPVLIMMKKDSRYQDCRDRYRFSKYFFKYKIFSILFFF